MNVRDHFFYTRAVVEWADRSGIDLTAYRNHNRQAELSRGSQYYLYPNRGTNWVLVITIFQEVIEAQVSALLYYIRL